MRFASSAAARILLSAGTSGGRLPASAWPTATACCLGSAMVVPRSVMVISDEIRIGSPAERSAAWRASPKSMTRTWPELVIITFSPLKSR